MKPGLHTRIKHRLRFPPLLHASYIRDCPSAPLRSGLIWVLCPIRRLVPALYCVLLKVSSLVSAIRLGPEINFQACPWVLIRHHHIAICWLSIHHFIFFLIFCLRDLQGQFMTKQLVNSSFFFQLVSNFISAYPSVWGPGTVPQNAGWKCHSMPFSSVVPVGTFFAKLKCYQSRLTITAYTNVFLWCNIHMNFIFTGQDGMYLGLENCSIFS